MTVQDTIQTILASSIKENNHRESDYFHAIRQLIDLKGRAGTPEETAAIDRAMATVYDLLRDELLTNSGKPVSPVKFGTSGWRGMLGKDIFVRSVAFVTAAILQLYRDADQDPELRQALGVSGFAEMCRRGCVVGFDNRFGGPLLALAAMNVLAESGVRILYAGEATTGILSASVLVRKAAFSINLTPSHNPLEYGGFKYNAADAGPAAAILTERITRLARQIIDRGESAFVPPGLDLQRPLEKIRDVEQEDALASWQQLVRDNRHRHGIDYDRVMAELASRDDIVVGVDAVHGASRTYISRLLKDPPPERLFVLRDQADVTFGGIAPEPSSTNMQPVMTALAARPEPFRVGAIIDPDGDRIRFTDGDTEISMNQFGAMAYHFLHEIKGKKGMVAKTVATSNLANSVAGALGEEVFEPRVGFKEFKPVIGKALVYFEESDGISVIGHTPEKDAFIGLLLALDMTMSLGRSLADYLQKIESAYGPFYPARDGVAVSQQGEELKKTLARLEKYGEGVEVEIGGSRKKIAKVITIDGRKMIFEDGSWIMIRPSGTEPKVRFYVEARDRDETRLLVDKAREMLAEIGLLS